jgi:hypothetical protein
MVSVAMVLEARREDYFEKTAVSNFLIRAGMFVQLHLDDLVEAAIDGGKTFVHLFTEVADLIVHFVAEAADLIAWEIDDQRQCT